MNRGKFPRRSPPPPSLRSLQPVAWKPPDVSLVSKILKWSLKLKLKQFRRHWNTNRHKYTYSTRWTSLTSLLILRRVELQSEGCRFHYSFIPLPSDTRKQTLFPNTSFCRKLKITCFLFLKTGMCPREIERLWMKSFSQQRWEAA